MNVEQSKIDEISAILASCARVLTFIETDELERYTEAHQDSLSMWGTMGPMLEPTAYRDSLISGKAEDAKYLLAIAEALLLVRQAIDAREAFCQTIRKEA